jgi:hypothetical protein
MRQTREKIQEIADRAATARSLAYVNGMNAALCLPHGGIRQAWDAGQMVPCEACDDGGVYTLVGNQYRVETCRECDGTGYVLEVSNDK